jgi:hypothetical protein
MKRLLFQINTDFLVKRLKMLTVSLVQYRKDIKFVASQSEKSLRVLRKPLLR